MTPTIASMPKRYLRAGEGNGLASQPLCAAAISEETVRGARSLAAKPLMRSRAERSPDDGHAHAVVHVVHERLRGALRGTGTGRV